MCMSSRNIGKVRDWIDLVFVKKRFYSSEAVFAAAPPPVSRTQVHLLRTWITTAMTKQGAARLWDMSDFRKGRAINLL